MKSNLKVYTSYVSEENIEYFSKEDILPVFIIRNISNSPIISKWSGSPIHIKDLSPRTELFQRYKRGIIDFDTYIREYVIGLASVNFYGLMKRLETLATSTGAKGIVLMGYVTDPEKCHRKVLGEMIDLTGYFDGPVEEIKR